MTPDEITRLFTRKDGSYLFARWGRPIVPVVFGVDDATLSVIKGAVEAIVTLAGHKMAETDPELGANLMMFFCRDWAELPDVPHLDQLIPGLAEICVRLSGSGANQYRAFRFDRDGAIKAAFVFLRMDADLSAMPVDALALNEAAQVILLWGETAFAGSSPLARAGQTVVLKPEIAALIRAGYMPMMPMMSGDASHAYRLCARLGHIPG